MREAIGNVLARLADVEVVAVCNDGEELLRAVEREAPQVVITDVRMPPSGDDEGIRVASTLRSVHPQVGVVILSQYADSRYGLDLVADGAEGRAYLLKERVRDPAELLAAIQVVARGGSMIDPAVVRELMAIDRHRRDSPLAELTPRELEVLAAMAAGKSNSAIAAELVLTKRAVEKHIGSIFAKLDLQDETIVSRRVAAVLLFLDHRGG
jgi:DNA-binding NarL/FixJ family response regulator